MAPLTLYPELDALGLDDELVGENETPSYLQDSTALPDFVDAAPVEEEVSSGAGAELTHRRQSRPRSRAREWTRVDAVTMPLTRCTLVSMISCWGRL
jgi:hypothetical protein